jgi:FkbM family methyltransferase
MAVRNSIIKRIGRRMRSWIARDPDRFLKNIRGVIHVGANTGQEIELYAKHGLNAVWVEPIPEVYDMLKENLRNYPRQSAFQYLVTDRDDAEYRFNVANNNGESSSILEIALHKDLWPSVHFERSINLKSISLASLVQKESLDITQYQALIIDTQGSELLVLRGGEALLKAFKYIKLEVPDFESYKGCCQLKDVGAFLHERGFTEFSRTEFAERSQGGSYYDIVYQRT